MEYKRIYCEDTVAHFLTDKTGVDCGDFTFGERDLRVQVSKQINLNEQPSQVVVSHPKIPGLSWMIFIYQTGQTQYQPKIAYDLPGYLRADAEVCIRFGGMHWIVKAKFEGSNWLTKQIPPKVMNERWTTLSTVATVEVVVSITKMWFQYPLFSSCCHPIKTKKVIQQPCFTAPDYFSDCQLAPQEPNGRRLFTHRQVLAMNSDWFAERFRRVEELNSAATGGPIVPVPFPFQDMLNFLQLIYPNSGFHIDQMNVEAIMDIAKEYHVEHVIRKCEKFLYKNLEGGSALLSYHLARKHELTSLQDAALLHISELNATQVRSRVNLDLKGKPADVQEALIADLSRSLAECHM